MRRALVVLVAALLSLFSSHAGDARLVRPFNSTAGFVSCASLAGGGCAGWWSADTGVTTAGSIVGSVTDRSGNGQTMTQATAGPTLVTGPPAYFSYTGGGSARLQTGAATVSAYPLEYFVVAWLNSAAVGGNLYLIDTSGNTAALYGSGAGGTTLTAFTLGSSATLTTTFPTNAIEVIDASWPLGNNNANFYINGALNANHTNDNSAISPTNFTIGDYGGSGPFSNDWNGRVYEVLLFSRQLSSADRTMVCTYLCNKYAVTCTCSVAAARAEWWGAPLLLGLGALAFARRRAANDDAERRAA